MADRKDNDFLNGVPELLILRLLARQPMYGYELVQAIKLSTGGVLQFGEGCVYPILHRLEAEKVLASRREAVNGRSRVVYRLATAGKRRLAESAAHWEQVAAAVARVLRGEDDGSPAVV
ncbi:PadR family transcriptional regulator [Fimbriiglobus ruber]|uniref:Transcriptional regulator, PadR family n=1 Tax=Fimbriiglobus ruber TaxID=1908690 RepID=A0A225DVT7_9BACT|nr:PadR family transcriptional regulator [Fimbriiglobus ruber]OWK41746.1 Transcriptional regulator, PadR family [Fimbriiglobus ruber]